MQNENRKGEWFDYLTREWDRMKWVSAKEQQKRKETALKIGFFGKNCNWQKYKTQLENLKEIYRIIIIRIAKSPVGSSPPETSANCPLKRQHYQYLVRLGLHLQDWTLHIWISESPLFFSTETVQILKSIFTFTSFHKNTGPYFYASASGLLPKKSSLVPSGIFKTSVV